MKKAQTFLLLTLAASTATFTACNSGPKIVDENSSGQIMRGMAFDTQDAVDAASELAQSLLKADILGKGGKPSYIVISRYINNTGEQIDRDSVVKRIRVALNQAGVAQTITSLDSTGSTENAEDTFGANERERQEFTYNGENAPPSPEYSLTFKILKDRVSQGSKNQVTYTLQMSLNDIRNGIAVWEDEKRVVTQGKDKGIGW